MKKITQNLRWLVTLLAMIVCTGAWAETSTVTASKVTSSSASWTGSANETWAVTVDGGALNQNVTNDFAQIGTKNSPSTSITFSTSDISGTITKIEVECASYSGLGTISATVGSEDFGTQEQSIPTWSSNSGGTVTFFGSASGEIVITMTNGTGGRAMYIKSITVTYSNSGETPTPSITVDPTTVNATAEETEGTLAISYDNLDISSTTSFGIQYYNASNEEIDKPDWIVVEVESEEAGVSYMISYVIDANQGEARTAYCKVYAMDDETNLVYSNLITINQAAYVAPVSEFATLPFEFNDGKSAIESTDGLTQEGLDSDYASSPKLKFKEAGSWVLLAFDEAPGDLSFDIKGYSFSGGTFTVQTSKDGETYTDLKNYTVSNLGTSTQTETFNNLSSDVRYIKWIYTEKASGNVGLGNIQLKKAVPQIIVTNTTIDVDENEHEGTLEVTYKIIDPELAEIHFYAEDGETTATYDWIVAELDVNNNIEYLISANEGEARTAYLKVYGLDAEANDVYSGLITINQAAYVAPSTPVKYELVTDVNQLEDGQEYIIVGKNNDTYYAMSAQKNNNRGAVEISVSGSIATISSSEVQVITLEEDNDGWNFYTGELGYLYAAASNNNYLRTETTPDENGNAKATIVISSDGDATIVFQGNYTRNNLRFNNSSNNGILFSCYGSTSVFPLVQLYKKVVEEETSPTVTIGASKWATYVAEDNVTFPSEVSAFTVETINIYSDPDKTDHVTLGRVDAVIKGTPVLVYSAPGTYQLAVVDEDACDETSNNQLKVSKGDVTGDGSIYVLAKVGEVVGFYPAGNDIAVPEGKAYLQISGSTQSVKGFLALGDFADAINNITAETANGTIFNIAGQKVQNITKGGLYIVNGKKVIVK